MWIQKLIKVGDSLAVVIPAQLRRDLSLVRGDYLVLVLGQYDKIIMQQVDDRKAMELMSDEVVV